MGCCKIYDDVQMCGFKFNKKFKDIDNQIRKQERISENGFVELMSVKT
jgi:hypothetical protein